MLTVSLKTEYEMVLIKLNMVLGLKFLRLYIFFFYRDEYCTYSSETVPMES